MQEALRKRKVADVGHGEKVAIPTRGISEPIFHHNRRTGRTDHVVPGNKEYLRGDEIPRPNGGEGQGGREGSPDGSGEDAFEFTLTGKSSSTCFSRISNCPIWSRRASRTRPRSICSAPAIPSPARRPISACRARCATAWDGASRCRRPKLSEIEALRAKVEEARARGDDEEADRLAKELERIERRSKIIPYIDPIDVRYRRFDRVPKPNTEAVMFCLMDVSGSMTEAMKDLAKRFFMLLHVFLVRRYRHVDIVFIRHTSTAEEVDEETFFYSRETGGTVVSTALEKMLEIARARYPTDRWNIYGAQASDGDNYGADSGRCVSLLGNDVLPLCQYFAYIEVGDGLGGSLTGLSRDSDLWRAYSEVAPAHPHFAMRRVGDPAQIFSVFHELFAKGGVRA